MSLSSDTDNWLPGVKFTLQAHVDEMSTWEGCGGLDGAKVDLISKVLDLVYSSGIKSPTIVPHADGAGISLRFFQSPKFARIEVDNSDNQILLSTRKDSNSSYNFMLFDNIVDLVSSLRMFLEL